MASAPLFSGAGPKIWCRRDATFLCEYGAAYGALRAVGKSPDEIIADIEKADEWWISLLWVDKIPSVQESHQGGREGALLRSVGGGLYSY